MKNDDIKYILRQGIYALQGCHISVGPGHFMSTTGVANILNRVLEYIPNDPKPEEEMKIIEKAVDLGIAIQKHNSKPKKK